MGTSSSDLSKLKGEKKTLYCIRHAESEANAARKNTATWFTADFWDGNFNTGITDPEVSSKGQKEITKLKLKLELSNFLMKNKIDLIITSPLIRTIDTTLSLFHDEISSCGVPIIVHPDCRPYNSKSSSSISSNSKSELELKYANYNLDFTYLKHSKWDKKDFKEEKEIDKYVFESEKETKMRLKGFKLFLSGRKEKNIVIVSHCGFLRKLLNLWKSVSNCGIEKAHMIGTHIVDSQKYKF
eukprot:437501_1